MIGVFTAAAGVFTLYLVLFPTMGASVQLAYLATLGLLAFVSEGGLSRLCFGVLAGVALLSDYLLARMTNSFALFATCYVAALFFILTLLTPIVGRRRAWPAAALVTVLVLMLELRYFLDDQYDATPQRSLTLLTLIGFAAAGLATTIAAPLRKWVAVRWRARPARAPGIRSGAWRPRTDRPRQGKQSAKKANDL